MTNRFDINRSQRGIPAFSVLLIMTAQSHEIGQALRPVNQKKVSSKAQEP